MARVLVDQDFEVSIVIPVHNQWEYLQQCLDKIGENTTGIKYEVIIVDDASDKATKEYLQRQKRAKKIRVVTNRIQYGFPISCNCGIRSSRAEFACLLNSDTLPTDGWLANMLAAIRSDRLIGIVGPATNCRNNKQMHHELLKVKPQNVEQASQQVQTKYKGQATDSRFLIAFCWLMRRSMCDRIGLFDVRFGLGGGEDIEYQKRARIYNYRVVWARDSFVYHFGHRTFKNEKVDLFAKELQKQQEAQTEKCLKEHHLRIRQIRKMAVPKVSIVVPVRNRAVYFEQFYGSLLNSTKVTYELIIVDDASDAETKALIRELVTNPLIPTFVFTNETQQGYAKTCNRGMREARGEYICLASTDILVATGWLDRLVEAADAMPEGGMFGPSTNIDNKYQIPFECTGKIQPTEINHLALELERKYGTECREVPIYAFCYLLRSSMVTQIGYYDEQFGIGMGEDIEYRYRANYHGWKGIWVKSAFVYHYGHKSIQKEFQHKGAYTAFKEQQKALAEHVIFIRYSKKGQQFMDDDKINLSIVIPVHNGLDYVRGCVASVVRHTRHFELILVDDMSTPETATVLDALVVDQPKFTLIRNTEQLGFGKSCNKGIEAAKGPYICLLNSDTLVTKGWAEKILLVAEKDEKFGLLGPTTNFGNKFQEIRAAHRVRSPAHLDRHYEKVIEPLTRGQYVPRYLTAFCWIMSRKMIDDIGVLDERFLIGMYEDLEYLERAWVKGYQSIWVKDAFVYHYGHKSFKAAGVNDKRWKARNLKLLEKIRRDRGITMAQVQRWMKHYAQ